MQNSSRGSKGVRRRELSGAVFAAHRCSQLRTSLHMRQHGFARLAQAAEQHGMRKAAVVVAHSIALYGLIRMCEIYASNTECRLRTCIGTRLLSEAV